MGSYCCALRGIACRLSARSGRQFRNWVCRLDGAGWCAIGAFKREPQIMRFELTLHEWTAIERKLSAEKHKQRGLDKHKG
jgi:hypothetical protein